MADNDIFALDMNIQDALVVANFGDRFFNRFASRSVTVIDDPRERYQLTKGNMISGLTKHESVAVNFLMGG